MSRRTTLDWPTVGSPSSLEPITTCLQDFEWITWATPNSLASGCAGRLPPVTVIYRSYRSVPAHVWHAVRGNVDQSGSAGISSRIRPTASPNVVRRYAVQVSVPARSASAWYRARAVWRRSLRSASARSRCVLGRIAESGLTETFQGVAQRALEVAHRGDERLLRCSVEVRRRRLARLPRCRPLVA